MILPLELEHWAARHGIGEEALADLAVTLGASAHHGGAGSEGRVQSEIRLAARDKGFRFFRNNVGVLKNQDGIPVRYGLANESKRINDELKSSDLIGWRRLIIHPNMVGKMVAQFTAIECKAGGWKYTGTDREQAQLRFISLVADEGGYARFATGPDEL